MKRQIKSYKWRNNIDKITSKDLRIGTDVLLIEDANAIRSKKNDWQRAI